MLGAFGFLLLIPALVFLSSAIDRRTEGGRWAAQTALLAGMGYVTAALAVGFPAGGAAMYGQQHRLDANAAFAAPDLLDLKSRQPENAGAESITAPSAPPFRVLPR
jgi:hypothetical protein